MIEKAATIDLIRKLIQEYMDLDPTRVVIYNQPAAIPPVDGLWVAVQFEFSRPLSNRSSYKQNADDSGELDQVQDSNFQSHFTIKIMSKDETALMRKEEVLMALTSDLSQRYQEDNSFLLSFIGDIRDVSEVEASARLYRYDIEVIALDWYKKSKTVPSYDNYEGKIQTEQQELEFTQKTEEP